MIDDSNAKFKNTSFQYFRILITVMQVDKIANY